MCLGCRVRVGESDSGGSIVSMLACCVRFQIVWKHGGVAQNGGAVYCFRIHSADRRVSYGAPALDILSMFI